MAESDSTVEILKDIRDEIRGARNELRDEIRGVRTERVERPDGAWRRKALSIGIAAVAGATAVVVCVLAFRGGGKADQNVGVERVVASMPTPPVTTPSPPDPPPPTLAVIPPTTAALAVAPQPEPVTAPKKVVVRHRMPRPSEAELEPAKL